MRIKLKNIIYMYLSCKSKTSCPYMEASVHDHEIFKINSTYLFRSFMTFCYIYIRIFWFVTSGNKDKSENGWSFMSGQCVKL
jgi:fucose permease